MTYGDPALLRGLEAERQRGRRVPQLDERPEVPDELAWVVAAFRRLSDSRRWDRWTGMPEAIPCSEIEAWARPRDVAGEQFEELDFFLSALDGEFLRFHAEKIARRSAEPERTPHDRDPDRARGRARRREIGSG